MAIGRAVCCRNAARSHERTVGVGAHEIVAEDLVEALHVHALDRADVVAVESVELIEVGPGCGFIGHGISSSVAPTQANAGHATA